MILYFFHFLRFVSFFKVWYLRVKFDPSSERIDEGVRDRSVESRHHNPSHSEHPANQVKSSLLSYSRTHAVGFQYETYGEISPSHTLSYSVKTKLYKTLSPILHSVKRSDATRWKQGYITCKTPSPILHCISQLGENKGGQGHWVSLQLVREAWRGINPLTAKLFHIIFYPLEVASRWRDPQLQVCEIYLFLTKWGSKI